MTLPRAISARRQEAMRLRRLPLILSTVAALSWGCLGARADLSRGDPAPALMQTSGRMTVAIVATVEDCLSCDLRGVHVALRAMEGGGAGDVMPEIVVLAVTRDARDTLFFRQTLHKERVTGRVELLEPQAARKIFDGNKLPAMYLIKDGRVVHEWKPTRDQRIVMIDRNDLREAVSNKNER